MTPRLIPTDYMGKLRAQEINRFCYRCGEQVVLVGVVPFNKFNSDMPAYDRYSGKKLWQYEYVCPNKKWWDTDHEHLGFPIV